MAGRLAREGGNNSKWDKKSQSRPNLEMLAHSALPNAGHTSNHNRSAGDGEGGDRLLSGKGSIQFPHGNADFDKTPPTTEPTFHSSSNTGVELKGKLRARQRC
jgi:hypothetical protein